MQEQYRLFIDESGHHQLKTFGSTNERYLCLLGCWMRLTDHTILESDLASLKQDVFRNSIYKTSEIYLHRSTMKKGRLWYSLLQNAELRSQFENGFVKSIRRIPFNFTAVIFDKKKLKDLHLARGTDCPHPYNLAATYMLERYCGFLTKGNAVGDIWAESRTRNHDMVLQNEINKVYKSGTMYNTSHVFRRTLTTPIIQFKEKEDNVAGLQLSDHSATEVRSAFLLNAKIIPPTEIRFTDFESRILAVLRTKVYRNRGRIMGYGIKFHPDE